MKVYGPGPWQRIGVAANVEDAVLHHYFGECLATVECHRHAARQIRAHGLRQTDQMSAEIAVTSTAMAAIAAGSSISMRASDSLDGLYVHIMFQVGQS